LNEDYSKYNIDLEIKFEPLQLIDIPTMMDDCKKEWSNFSLCKVNDCVVRLAVIHKDFHWHKHDKEDEFFYVIDGKLLIDLEDETIELNPKQGFLVPKGIIHRTRAPIRTSILMVEGSTVQPVGD
jgi:mannose-6-phosphate isomerase-like protein (cupin superfamily)